MQKLWLHCILCQGACALNLLVDEIWLVEKIAKLNVHSIELQHMKRCFLLLAFLLPFLLKADIPSFEGTEMYIELLNAGDFPGWKFYFEQVETGYDPEMGGRYVSGHHEVVLEAGKHYLVNEDGDGAYLFAKNEAGKVLQSSERVGIPEGPYFRDVQYMLSKVKITEIGEEAFGIEVEKVVSILENGKEKPYRGTKKGAVLDPGLVLPLIAFIGLLCFFIFRRRLGYV